MSKATVRLHSPGVRELLNDGGLGEHLESLGRRVEAAAKANAPVQTGQYRESISVWLDHTDRVVCRIGAGVDYAVAVEAKTGNLSRSLDAAG